VTRVIIDAELLLDQMGHARASPQRGPVSQSLWPLQEKFGEPLTIRSRQERLATGATGLPQTVLAAGPEVVHPACHCLARDPQAASHFRLVQPLLPKVDRLKAPFLQSLKIASNSGCVAHTRLDAVSRKRYHYIMRESIILRRNILTNLKTVTETAREFGKETQASMEELGRSAGRKLDEAREETGAALHTAASSVRTTGRQGSEAIDNLATGAADRLDATASYIEDHDLQAALTNLRRFGRRHPTGSLMAAVAIGFLAGSALCRATHSCGRAPAGT
jgi:hypothetical protein